MREKKRKYDSTIADAQECVHDSMAIADAQEWVDVAMAKQQSSIQPERTPNPFNDHIYFSSAFIFLYSLNVLTNDNDNKDKW